MPESTLVEAVTSDGSDSDQDLAGIYVRSSVKPSTRTDSRIDVLESSDSDQWDQIFDSGTEIGQLRSQEAENKREIEGLREEVRGLQSLVQDLLCRVGFAGGLTPQDAVRELRNIEDGTAREEILGLFVSDPDRTFYYGDIAQELSLDLVQVVRVCNALEAEGRIALDDRA